MDAAETPPLVSMRAIRKSFGGTEVLHGVDFGALPGEVHVLAGENGAGKSTLIKILSGVYDDFTGELEVGGRSRRFTHPSQAVGAGIATIHQELSLVPTMSVADNLFLGQERTRGWGQVDFSFQASRADAILRDTGLQLTPGQLVEEIPIAAQQTLETARALAREATVLIFDEPTSALGEREVEALFGRITQLRSRGAGIVYITHKMEEIYRLADRITVLRDGEVVGSAPVEGLGAQELVKLMVGREVARPTAATAPDGAPAEGVGATDKAGMDALGARGTPPILEVEGLRVAHPTIRDRAVVEDVSFSLRKGEILGLAGLQGAGISEVLHALFGALEGRSSGRATLAGEPLPLRSPRASVERGLLLLSNDRKAKGLAPEMSVTHSVSLSSLDRFSLSGGWVRREKERAAVEELTREFRLNAPSLDSPVRALSGGNQQKVYLARCLLPAPRVLLLDEPTRGIDVGAKADIYQLMEEWVQEGIGILLVTSEMDELLTLSHRILVLHRGRVVAELGRDAATKDAILAAAMGHGETGAAATGGWRQEMRVPERTSPSAGAG